MNWTRTRIRSSSVRFESAVWRTKYDGFQDTLESKYTALLVYEHCLSNWCSFGLWLGAKIVEVRGGMEGECWKVGSVFQSPQRCVLHARSARRRGRANFGSRRWKDGLTSNAIALDPIFKLRALHFQALLVDDSWIFFLLLLVSRHILITCERF